MSIKNQIKKGGNIKNIIMTIPYYSSEIRWFSKDKDNLLNIYKRLPSEGNICGVKEPVRTDYYLKTGLISTSIKIREEKHEIKVKCWDDEVYEPSKKKLGKIEHWSKWSTEEENNIINTISEAQRTDWISVTKKRDKKKYAINKSTGQVEYTVGRPDDGCGVEYTELEINGSSLYTFGLESFGTYRCTRENLMEVLELFKDYIKAKDLGELECMGYPEYLIRF